MFCVITKRNAIDRDDVEIVYKGFNHREALDYLESIAVSTIEQLQGVINKSQKTDSRALYKKGEKPALENDRGYFARSFPNRIIIYEKKKNTTFYTGPTYEYCIFELMAIKLDVKDLLNSSAVVTDFDTLSKSGCFIKNNKNESLLEYRKTQMDYSLQDEFKYILADGIKTEEVPEELTVDDIVM